MNYVLLTKLKIQLGWLTPHFEHAHNHLMWLLISFATRTYTPKVLAHEKKKVPTPQSRCNYERDENPHTMWLSRVLKRMRGVESFAALPSPIWTRTRRVPSYGLATLYPSCALFSPMTGITRWGSIKSSCPGKAKQFVLLRMHTPSHQPARTRMVRDKFYELIL